MLTYADVCWAEQPLRRPGEQVYVCVVYMCVYIIRMPYMQSHYLFADVCGRMLTYADVWLTYTDVCRALRGSHALHAE